MRLKRIAAMLTTAVMAVSLAACGGNTDTTQRAAKNRRRTPRLRQYI